MKKILSLYKRYEEVINYLVTGGITTVVNLVIYYIMTYFIVDPSKGFQLQVANVISWVISVLLAYILQRKFVFKSENKNKVKEFMMFTGSRITTLVLDMLIMFVFVTVLRQNDKVFKLISQVLVIVGNYVLGKLVVFKKK